MNRMHNPSAIAPPQGRYSHGIEVASGARWLQIVAELIEKHL